MLLRPDMGHEWKGTVLRLALEGKNKQFISADYVQVAVCPIGILVALRAHSDCFLIALWSLSECILGAS